MSCKSKTHKLVIKTLGSQVERYWVDLDDGQVETDADVLASLEALIDEEDCFEGDVNCVESQEWTYGIDNTGTRFNDVADYEIKLSDGSVLRFSQDGSSTSWAQQLTEWAANIQTAVDAAGLAWFVEPRYVDNPNPVNIDGTINGPNGRPSGLPGAPSVAVATALIAGGMAWRYVNIQICPGQPVPVSAKRVNSAQFTNNPYELTTAGAILGPIQKFSVCRECGKEPIWYLEDGVTLATSGQIPNCYEPCGTLALTDAPPDRDCTFQTELACDNNNSTVTADFTPDITRRATICNGEQISVDYFQADPDDASALIPYTLIGRFVDCATGEEIALPPQPCSDFVSLGKGYYIETDETPETLVEWWADPNGTQSGTAVPHGNVSDIFTNDGTTMTHVSGPADNSYVADTFSVAGTNAPDFLSGMGGLATSDTSGTDQGKLSAHFYLTKPALLRDGGTRTGERGGLWLNECCDGELELLEERTVDTDSSERGVFNGTVVPAGIHYAEALISDLSAWWNLTLEASFDGGVTYGPLLGYKNKPTITCINVIKCKDSGLLLNAFTMEVLDPERLLCENPCAPCGCASSNPQELDMPLAIGRAA